MIFRVEEWENIKLSIWEYEEHYMKERYRAIFAKETTSIIRATVLILHTLHAEMFFIMANWEKGVRTIRVSLAINAITLEAHMCNSDTFISESEELKVSWGK